MSNSTFLASDLFIYDYKSNIFLKQKKKERKKPVKRQRESKKMNHNPPLAAVRAALLPVCGSLLINKCILENLHGKTTKAKIKILKGKLGGGNYLQLISPTNS